MKDCFEQLRARLPANQNNKSSKWETLSRGEYASATGSSARLTGAVAIEYITQLENQVKQQRMDSEKQRHQLQDMESKIREMSQQMQRLQHPAGGAYPPPAPPNSLPQSPLGYGSHFGNNGIDGSNEPTRTLPPLVNGAMQGVQYSDDRR